MTAATNADKKAQRRAFAFAAARRIHAQLQDLETRLWRQEGQAAKDAGLYAASTYNHDAGTALRGFAGASRGRSMIVRIEEYLP